MNNITCPVNFRNIYIEKQDAVIFFHTTSCLFCPTQFLFFYRLW